MLTNFNPNLQMEILQYTTTILAFILSIVCSYICLCEFLFFTKIQFFRRSTQVIKFISQKINIRIRIMDVLGIIFGFGIASLWILTGKNWIISDVIYFFMYTTIIKTIKYGSLKIALAAYIIIGIADFVFIIITYMENYYFNNIILTIFNNPFFIMCPTINFVPDQQCSWFFISCISAPGIILAYLRRFD